jgi:hypothetical protein
MLGGGNPLVVITAPVSDRQSRLHGSAVPTGIYPTYTGSEAKAHPFRGGMKPTAGNPSTFVATAGVGCLSNIFR